MRIPRTIHVVWIGDETKRPDNCIDSWRKHNPSWSVRVWGNQEWCSRPWTSCAHMAAMTHRELNGVADMMRWEILRDEGGFCVDADSVCVRSLEDWLFDEHESVACWENERAVPGLIAAGYVAAVPHTPFFTQLVEDLRRKPTVVDGAAWVTVGPKWLTESVKRQHYRNMKLWPSHYFIPEHHSGIRYSGPGPIFARQEWAGTRGLYDTLYQKKLE